MNEVSLANKVAIGGGGRGIGEAIARRLATAGAAGAIAELDPSSGASVANALEADSARGFAFKRRSRMTRRPYAASRLPYKGSAPWTSW